MAESGAFVQTTFIRLCLEIQPCDPTKVGRALYQGATQLKAVVMKEQLQFNNTPLQVQIIVLHIRLYVTSEHPYPNSVSARGLRSMFTNDIGKNQPR